MLTTLGLSIKLNSLTDEVTALSLGTFIKAQQGSVSAVAPTVLNLRMNSTRDGYTLQSLAERVKYLIAAGGLPAVNFNATDSITQMLDVVTVERFAAYVSTLP